MHKRNRDTFANASQILDAAWRRFQNWLPSRRTTHARVFGQLCQLEDRSLLSGTPLDADVEVDLEVANANNTSTTVADIVEPSQSTLVALQGPHHNERTAEQSQQYYKANQSVNTPSPNHLTDTPASKSTPEIQHSQAARRELVILDQATEDYQQLVEDLLDNQDPNRQLDVVVLAGDENGIEQISEVLAGYRHLDSLHIVSHGTQGSVKLGNTWLGEANVEQYAHELTEWAKALNADADVLFYGCNLAASQEGQHLLELVSDYCGCDVAASDDNTGHQELGGDWHLEYQLGSLETDVPWSQATQGNWQGLLAAPPGEMAPAGNVAPTITSPSAVAMAENTSFVMRVTTTDPDGGPPTFAIIGGADFSFFTLNIFSGDLLFQAPPDFENPLDTGNDNTYEVEIQVNDGAGGSATQVITVTITDVGGPLIVDTTDDTVNGTVTNIESLQQDKGADGRISLREAIRAINGPSNPPGTAQIHFNIPGAGPHTIVLGSALQPISRSVIIDGWTEPDYAGSPIIVLDGSGAGSGVDGLHITSGNSTVRGLVIHSFNGDGIELSGSGNNIIEGNYIGTNATGNSDFGNGLDGIHINNSSGNTIGGTSAAQRNVISGNNIHGIRINGGAATLNTIQGNYIGLNASGAGPVGNTFNGIWIAGGASNNVVGGPTALPGFGPGNVISGNGDTGVEVQDSTSTANRIEGNIIGLNAFGDTPVGNVDGVILEDAPSNIVGGPTTNQRNIISGNNGPGLQGNGVVIFGTNATGNLVQNNFLGTDLFGNTGLGNFGEGVVIDDSGDGGVNKGPASANIVRDNVISANNRDGVEITDGAFNNHIHGNRIGTRADGTGDLGNTDDGISILNGAHTNFVGSPALVDRNVISGNQDTGLTIEGDNNVVLNNFLGTDAAGVGNIGNTNTGIRLFGGAANNIIGGVGPNEGNVIAFSGTAGVAITGALSDSNTVRGNAIHTSGGLGIDLGNDGVTANDAVPLDPDLGPNNSLNFPVLSAAQTNTTDTITITGAINAGLPNTGFDVDFYYTLAEGGEGQFYLGSISRTTDLFGNVTFTNISFTANVPVGAYITATATATTGIETGNTSEFSADFQATAPNPPPTADSGGPYAINEGDGVTLDASGSTDPESDPLTYNWDLDNDGNYDDAVGAVLPLTWFQLGFFGINDDGVYNIGVEVNDGNGNIVTDNTTITVSNQPPTANDDSGTGFVTDEATAFMTANVLSNDTDPNTGDALAVIGLNTTGTVGLVIDNGDGTFDYDPNGQFETLALGQQTTDTFSYTISDGDGGTDFATVTITIHGLNDASTIGGTASSQPVNDNATIDPFAAITIDDVDTGESVTITLTLSGGDTNGVFTSGSLSASGFVKIGAGQYQLIGVTPAAGQAAIRQLTFDPTENQVAPGNTVSTTFTIDVDDGDVIASNNLTSVGALSINDAPVVTPGQNFGVAENAGNGFSLGNVLATDADPGTSFVNWAITDGNTEGIFAINPSTGELTIFDNTNLDFEATSNYTLKIRVEDSLTQSLEEDVVINIGDVNEAPTITLIANQTILADGSTGPLNFTVGDPETAADSLIVTATSDNQSIIPNANISITGSGANKDITVTPAANQSGGPVTITVVVDDGVNQTQTTFAVTVVPRVITVTTTADELDGDTTNILTLLATPGGAGISLREAIIATNNTLLGTTPDQIILPTGNYVLSRGSGDDSGNNGDLDIRDDILITGGGARTTTIDGDNLDRIFDVRNLSVATITDVTMRRGNSNSGALFVHNGAVLNLTDVTVRESSGINGGAAHVLGTLNLDRVTLTANTATNNGAALYFQGADAGALRNVTISGNNAVNNGGAIWTDSIISVAHSTLAENTAAAGAGVFVAGGDVILTNSILANLGGNSNTGLTSGNYNIDSDGTALLGGANDQVLDPLLNPLANYGGPTDTHALKQTSAALNPTGLAGAPTIDQRGVARDATPDIGAFEGFIGNAIGPINDIDVAADEVNEQAGTGTFVGISALAIDPDAGDTVTYTLDNDAGGRFAIHWTSGVVTVANGTLLDFETDTSHVITVRATSSDTSFLTRDFTINVRNINEPPQVNDQVFNVDEQSANGTRVGFVNVSEPDAGQNHTFTVTGGTGTLAFTVNSSTGEIVVADGSSLDFETTPSYTLNILVTDNGVPALADPATITINLNDVAETSVFQTATPITIDGNVEAAWTPAARETIAKVSSGVVAGTGDLSGTWRSLWDANNLYMLVDVTDDVLHNDSVDPFQDDIVEIFLDTDNSRGTVYDGVNDFQYGFRWNDPTVHVGVSSVPDTTGITFNIVNTATGYRLEAAIPWTTLNITPAAGDVVGIDVHIGDDDNGGFRDGKLSWQDPFDLAFLNPSLFGIGELRPLGNNPPVIDSSSTPSVAENTTFVQTVTATDIDADSMQFSISGGADAAFFNINMLSGMLSFQTAPDFENPQDANGDNVYEVDITANDGRGGLDVETVLVTVTGVNDNAPLFTSITTPSIQENTTFVLTINATDADLPTQTITYDIVGGVDAGLFNINSTSGDLSFALAPDFESAGDNNGDNVYEIIVRADDNTGSTSLQNMTIAVIDVNEPPVVYAQTFNVDENTPNTTPVGNILATDPDFGQALTWTVTGGTGATAFGVNPTTGQITVADATQLDFETTPSFTLFLTVNDNGSPTLSDTATVTINLGDVPEQPIAVDDIYSTAEDTPLTVNVAGGVLANDNDDDGDTLTAVKFSDPTNGSVLLNGDGSFTYVPNFNFFGTDSFTYQAFDGGISSNIATVSITVTPRNDPPVAVADSFTTNEGVPLVISASGVLANDLDVDGDSLTAVPVTGPSFGSLVLNSDGSFTYNPNPLFNGTDSFTYRVHDGTINSNIATVTIGVNPVNDPPVTVPDIFATNEEATLTVNASTGILSNDSDADGDPLTAVLVSGPSNGLLRLNSDGSFDFTAHKDFNGVDGFSYRAFDGNVYTAPTNVLLVVWPVDDVPVGRADHYEFNPKGQASFQVTANGLLANDFDVDGDVMTAQLVDAPAKGTVFVHPNGAFVYTTEDGFVGTVSFSYQVHTAAANSNLVRVTINVHPGDTSVDDVLPAGLETPSFDEGTPEAVHATVMTPPERITYVPPRDTTVQASRALAPAAAGTDVVVIVMAPSSNHSHGATSVDVFLGVPNGFGVRDDAAVTTGSTWTVLPIVSEVDYVAERTSWVVAPLDSLELPEEFRSTVRQIAITKELTMTGVMATTGLMATAGYVLLNTRALAWLFTLFATQSAWNEFDPLEVIYAWEGGKNRPRHGEKEESLVTLVERGG